MTKPLSENGLLHAEDLYYLLGGNEKIRLLDATYASVGGLSPYQAFLGERIEGAQFFDIDAVADQEAPLPHTLPSPEYFADCVCALGISNGEHVVVYDQSGMYMASSRAWWMFRAFGHDKVYVLEGGLQSWKAKGFRVVGGAVDAPAMGDFKAHFRSELVVSQNDVLNNIETGNFVTIDARPAARYHGLAPEPRPNMRAGHVPKSINIPFGDALESSFLKSDSAIEHLLEGNGISPSAKTAILCGSGVTACTLALAMFKARRQEAAIYDGSWSEWGHTSAGTPVEISS